MIIIILISIVVFVIFAIILWYFTVKKPNKKVENSLKVIDKKGKV